MTKTETDKRRQDQQSGSATLPRGGFSFETIEANRLVVTLRFAEAADAEAFLIKFWSEKSQMTQRCFGIFPNKFEEFSDHHSGDRTYGLATRAEISFLNRGPSGTELSPPTLQWLASNGVQVESAS